MYNYFFPPSRFDVPISCAINISSVCKKTNHVVLDAHSDADAGDMLAFVKYHAANVDQQ